MGTDLIGWTGWPVHVIPPFQLNVRLTRLGVTITAKKFEHI